MKHVKRFFAFVLVASMLCSLPATAVYAAAPAGIFIDLINEEFLVSGEPLQAVTVNGEFMLPLMDMAYLCYILGYDLVETHIKTEYKDDAYLIKFYPRDVEHVKENVFMFLIEDYAEAWAYGETQYDVLTDCPMTIIDGTLMLPLEYCMNVIGQNISYDEETNLVHIEKKPLGMRILLDSDIWFDERDKLIYPVFLNDTLMLTINQMATIYKTRGYVLTTEELDNGMTMIGVYSSSKDLISENLLVGLFLDSNDIWAEGKIIKDDCPTPPARLNGTVMMPIFYCMELISVPVKYISEDNVLHIGKTWGEELGETISAVLGAITDVSSQLDIYIEQYELIAEMNKEYKKIEDARQAQQKRQDMIKRVRAYDRYDWYNTEKQWNIATDIMNYFIDQKYVDKGKVTVDDVHFAISQGLYYYDTDSPMLAAKAWLGY